MKENYIFEGTLQGYKKKQVDDYISGCTEYYKKVIQMMQSEQKKLTDENNVLREKYDDLNTEYCKICADHIKLQNEKAQIANILINAENTASEIIEKAKIQALQEKEILEQKSEALRESIVDKNRVLRSMRIDIVDMYSEAKDQLEGAMEKISSMISDRINEFESASSDVEDKYSDVSGAEDEDK